MNDRFKFRAWNKETKTMHYNAEQTYDCMTGTPLIYKSSFGDVLDDENYIVEQCAGIKDKNGKLAFEGDIVKTKHDDVGVVIYSGHFLEWRIVFKKGRKHLLDNKEFGVPMFDFTENAIGKNILEIIGNTHQNPELLK